MRRSTTARSGSALEQGQHVGGGVRRQRLSLDQDRGATSSQRSRAVFISAPLATTRCRTRKRKQTATGVKFAPASNMCSELRRTPPFLPSLPKADHRRGQLLGRRSGANRPTRPSLATPRTAALGGHVARCRGCRPSISTLASERLSASKNPS